MKKKWSYSFIFQAGKVSLIDCHIILFYDKKKTQSHQHGWLNVKNEMHCLQWRQKFNIAGH